MNGTVKLVGTGPGRADLVTVQAAEAIRAADCVRHPEGDKVAAGLARPGADVAAWRSADEVLELAREGRSVAVLYPGDPYAFGAGAELAQRLERAGVPFEALPGLPVETAAPLLSGIPLTVEGHSASVLFGSGAADTVVLKLAAGWLESGIKSLLSAGRDPQTPAALLVGPGSHGQRRLEGALAELVSMAADRGLRGDTLLVVGPGVQLAGRLDTLGRKPLHLRRVLVTRARHQAAEFRQELEELGAIVEVVPTIEIRPATLTEEVRAAVERLPDTGLVVFASANAVDIFFELLLESGHDARRLHACKLCAIGPETAGALESHGLRPELVAGEYTAEGLAEALSGWPMEGVRVLVPRARVARDALPQMLGARGAEVQILPVYDSVSPAGLSARLWELLQEGGLDIVTFTASSTVSNFARALPGDRLERALAHARVACIGPVTADTARRAGMRVDIIAREYTTRGLAAAIAEAFS